MNVLIACEYSAIVRDAFRAKGVDAWSCDLLPTDGDPAFHVQGDVLEILELHKETIKTIIAHPPCTALAVSGNAWYGGGMPKYQQRLDSVEWTKKLWETCLSICDKVCFENPVGVLQRLGGFPKPHYIHPWQFGHMEQKKTGLYLHGLPPLQPTKDVQVEMMELPLKERQRLHYLPPSEDRWKIRSTTYQGIADAMAEQWCDL